MKDDGSTPGVDDPELESEVIRGEVRLAGHRRVSHGLFLPLRAGLSDEAEFVRDLRAWQRVLPEGSVFTHVTGARLRGWVLPKLPEHVPVFAAVEGNPGDLSGRGSSSRGSSERVHRNSGRDSPSTALRRFCSVLRVTSGCSTW